MQAKSIPHPLFCGFAWGALMFVIALCFVSAKHLWAVLAGAQPVQRIVGDQWLSLVKSVNRSWLAARFCVIVSFTYNWS